jgi:hypothetical protein
MEAKLTAAHGLAPIRLHNLRHTAASLALQADADLKFVSDQLGHSSIVLTADTYISVLSALIMKAAEDTARIIAKAGRRAPCARRTTRRTPKPPDPKHLSVTASQTPRRRRCHPWGRCDP